MIGQVKDSLVEVETKERNCVILSDGGVEGAHRIDAVCRRRG